MSRFEMIDDNDFTADELCPDAEDFDASEPIDMDECEHCGDLAEDLYPVESGDDSVGYREMQWLCEKCRLEEEEGMSHTKGPWKIGGSAVMGKCFTGQWRTICGVVSGGTPKEKHANCTLIAHAPDLLEALEPFAKFAEHWDASERRGLAQRDEDALYTVSFLPDQPPVSITLGHVRAARAAIKKARGE